LLKNKATKLLKIQGSVPESDKTKPISDLSGYADSKPSRGQFLVVPGSAAAPLDVRRSGKRPSPNDLVFSLVCGKAQPFHTSGGKAAIF
jgi:hypothetical protein